MSDLESKKKPTSDDPRILPAINELNTIFSEIHHILLTQPPSPIPPPPPSPTPSPPPPTPSPPPPTPSPPSPPPGTGFGPDGIKEIYPTASGGSKVYLNNTLDDPRKDPHFDFDSMNHDASVTKKTEGNLIYFNTPGDVVHYASGSPDGRTIRLDLYPGSGKGQKQKFSYANNPGFLYDEQGIRSHEFTGYIRGHGDLGSNVHHSLAMKVNGGDDDTIRSLVETNYPTITSGSGVYANWNYTHLAYEKVPDVQQIMSVPKLQENTWVGIKSVHKVSANRELSNFEYYVDLTPFDSNGNPNNTWQLAATWLDTGSPKYGMKCTWKCQADKIRVDGWKNVDFALMSDREIDFGDTPPSPPAPIPPPSPPSPSTLTVSDETLTTPQNQPLEITLVANDSIIGAALTFEIVNQPPDGTINQDQTNSSILVYTPNPGFAGKDIFNYRALDDKNQTSNVGTIGIIVTMPTQPPTPSPIPPPPSPVQIMGTVDVSNMSSASDSDIANWVAAVKIQADRDVAPIWGHSVNFNIIPKGGIPNNGNWQCGFFDNTDQPGDLGWHDAGPNGEPLIKCFVKEAEKFGESPSVTLSHEIIESIGDANANTTVKGFDNNGKPALLFQELCDMVESSIYQINGINVSDFVTPDWFNENPKSGFFDFLKVLSAPWKLAHGGYEQVSYDNGNTFTEIDMANKKIDLHNSEHSRWALYKKPLEQRKKSTFKTQ